MIKVEDKNKIEGQHLKSTHGYCYKNESVKTMSGLLGTKPHIEDPVILETKCNAVVQCWKDENVKPANEKSKETLS